MKIKHQGQGFGDDGKIFSIPEELKGLSWNSMRTLYFHAETVGRRKKFLTRIKRIENKN